MTESLHHKRTPREERDENEREDWTCEENLKCQRNFSNKGLPFAVRLPPYLLLHTRKRARTRVRVTMTDDHHLLLSEEKKIYVPFIFNPQDNEDVESTGEQMATCVNTDKGHEGDALRTESEKEKREPGQISSNWSEKKRRASDRPEITSRNVCERSILSRRSTCGEEAREEEWNERDESCASIIWFIYLIRLLISSRSIQVREKRKKNFVLTFRWFS